MFHPSEHPLDPSFSALIEVSKADVITEYERVARLPAAHQRAVWRSTAAMQGRWQHGLDVISWSGVRSWLDVGCGEGGFFRLADEAGHHFTDRLGVDIAPSIINRAREMTLSAPARFEVADLETLAPPDSPFDLVSAVGVLQKCGVPLDRFVAALIRQLAPGGTVYLTTKNRAWAGWDPAYATPEIGHSWFDPEELRATFVSAGFDVLTLTGLIPEGARAVPLPDSQTLALLARKTHSAGGPRRVARRV